MFAFLLESHILYMHMNVFVFYEPLTSSHCVLMQPDSLKHTYQGVKVVRGLLAFSI